jgi:hypothetical protein
MFDVGLKQITGVRRLASYGVDRQTGVKEPLLVIYENGKAQFTVRGGDLVSVTALTDQAALEKVIDFAKPIPEDAPWTKEQVSELCKLVGRIPFPKFLQVEHLRGMTTLLLQVATAAGPGITELHYAKQSNRPAFNIIPSTHDEGIKVPEKMCLEVPLTLVLDGNMLKVEAALSKGVQRAVKTRDPEKAETKDSEGDEDEDE